MYDELIQDLGNYSTDPLGFVHWAFPWSTPNTDLRNATGPEPWQREILIKLGRGLSIDAAIRLAVTSGHGVGQIRCQFPGRRACYEHTFSHQVENLD